MSLREECKDNPFKAFIPWEVGPMQSQSIKDATQRTKASIDFKFLLVPRDDTSLLVEKPWHQAVIYKPLHLMFLHLVSLIMN